MVVVFADRAQYAAASFAHLSNASSRQLVCSFVVVINQWIRHCVKWHRISYENCTFFCDFITIHSRLEYRSIVFVFHLITIVRYPMKKINIPKYPLSINWQQWLYLYSPFFIVWLWCGFGSCPKMMDMMFEAYLTQEAANAVGGPGALLECEDIPAGAKVFIYLLTTLCTQQPHQTLVLNLSIRSSKTPYDLAHNSRWWSLSNSFQ